MAVRLWGESPVMIRVDTDYQKDTSWWMTGKRNAFKNLFEKTKKLMNGKDYVFVGTVVGGMTIAQGTPTPNHPDGVRVTFDSDAITDYSFVSYSAVIENRHTEQWQPDRMFQPIDQALALKMSRHILGLIEPDTYLVKIDRTGLTWSLSLVDCDGNLPYVIDLAYKPVLGVSCTQYIDMKHTGFVYKER